MMKSAFGFCAIIFVFCAAVATLPQISIANDAADMGEGLQTELMMREKVSVLIKSASACSHEEKNEIGIDLKNDDNFLSGSICSGDKCTISRIVQNQHEYYTFLAKSKGQCRVLKAPGDRIRKDEVYYGSIKTTRAVLQSKGIDLQGKSVGELFLRSTKFGRVIASSQLNDIYNISIQYDNRPASDVLNVGGKEIVVMY